MCNADCRSKWPSFRRSSRRLTRSLQGVPVRQNTETYLGSSRITSQTAIIRAEHGFDVARCRLYAKFLTLARDTENCYWIPLFAWEASERLRYCLHYSFGTFPLFSLRRSGIWLVDDPKISNRREKISLAPPSSLFTAVSSLENFPSIDFLREPLAFIHSYFSKSNCLHSFWKAIAD